MWLINATSEDQRRGIAAYFSPMAKIENGFSGTGMVPGGASPVLDGAEIAQSGAPPQIQSATAAGSPDNGRSDDDGDPSTGTASIAQPVPAGMPASANSAAYPAGPGPSQSGGGFASAAAEDKALHETAQHLREAISHDPALANVAGQMAVDVTPEGLRIQIMDADHQPMFDSGAITPTLRAQALLRVAGRFIIGLPEPVSIGGYTDAAPYQRGQRSNWSLSSERADAARDVLAGAGLPDARLSNVTGYADRKLLLPDDPLSPANRRVVLVLQRTWPQPPIQAQSIPPGSR